MDQHLEQISQSVVKGDQISTIEFVQVPIDARVNIDTIYQKGLIPAMSELGSQFENGEYFVPETLTSARAMILYGFHYA